MNLDVTQLSALRLLISETIAKHSSPHAAKNQAALVPMWERIEQEVVEELELKRRLRKVANHG